MRPVSTGRPFPDGAAGGEPGNVVIFNGEDSPEDNIVPRLRAMDADLGRVFILCKETLDKDGPFRLPTHSATLMHAIEETRAVLVILDPIMAFLERSVQTGIDTSVRQALAPMAEAVRRLNCHAIMVRHLNKSGSFRSLYRGGGSIGILAACRSAFLFARDPHDPLRAVMAHNKNNDAPCQPSLAYRIRLQESGFPAVEWLGENPLSADQLLAFAGMKPYLPGAADRARDFLFAFLDDGPRPTIDIWPEAEKLGLGNRTLERVAKKMKMRWEKVCVHKRMLTYWLLPKQKLPPASPPKSPASNPGWPQSGRSFRPRRWMMTREIGGEWSVDGRWCRMRLSRSRHAGPRTASKSPG